MPHKGVVPHVQVLNNHISNKSVDPSFSSGIQ